jgi:SWI/SNF-related matrix-associated actin-dependent regulator 1 of chromatin subfamily A
MNRDIACPEGLAYFPYQIEGINFALERNGTLLGDEMGVGKTIQAIGLINALRDKIRRVLIFCPATMRLVWRAELERWLVSQFSIGVVGEDPVSLEVLARVSVLVINYDRLEKTKSLVLVRRWDLAILDECHLIKNPDTQRSKVVTQIKTARALALSGTPMPNRPIELYPILSWLDPERWPQSGMFNFANRYCAARHTAFGWDLSGASNLEELGQLLRSTVMIRRTKAEVLPQLPPKFRRVVELSPSTDLKKLVQTELTAFQNWQDKAIGKTSGDVVIRTFRSKEPIEWETLSKMRHAVALAKIPLACEFIEQTIQAKGDKVVLFAHHRDVIESLASKLQSFGPAILYGGMGANKKQAAIDRFQHDPTCRIFIGNIQAAGLGITLAPAASHCIFAELSWVPSDLTQAEDRLHRVGAKDNVLVQHLVLRGSLDAIMVRRLIRKQEVLDSVLIPSAEFAD